MAVATRPSSILMSNTNIGDLLEDVLVKILSRLPSYKDVFQCKCVSKQWCSLMSDPSFIRSFLCRQSVEQTEIIRTLINRQGVEFLKRLSLSAKPLTQLFERLMRVHHLKEEPVVVGTYNDLVLCCASSLYQREYHICNAYTSQWVPLPPPPQLYEFTSVGFICDLPYYQCRKEEDNHDHIQLNAEFRYRVVRLIDVPEKKLSFKIQIFSSETGEWGEWTVSIATTSSPVGNGAIDGEIYFPCNGVLYWMAQNCDFLIGVDPFMITDRNVTPDDGIVQYRCCFIEFDQHVEEDTCVGVNRGHLQMLGVDREVFFLYVVELNEEEVSKAGGKFYLKQRVKNYAVEWEMFPIVFHADFLVHPLCFDPNDNETVYLHIGDIGEFF